MVEAADAAVHDAGVRATDLRAIGITNQRETTLLWERATGRPVNRAIVWQDRRTAARCRELPAELIRARTGLVPDPYFSATKLEWLLARTDARPGELAFGTVDSWLVWKLTDGGVHATDLTNASRTMLLDLESLAWDDELLELFGVDRALLPRLVRSSEVVGEAKLLGATLPIAGIAGDQQAALFGHGCHERGEAKATYGTGSFVLVNAGAAREPPAPGLLETAEASGGYALEGAILSSGAASAIEMTNRHSTQLGPPNAAPNGRPPFAARSSTEPEPSRPGSQAEQSPGARASRAARRGSRRCTWSRLVEPRRGLTPYLSLFIGVSCHAALAPSGGRMTNVTDDFEGLPIRGADIPNAGPHAGTCD